MEDALERRRSFLAEFETLYGRYARRERTLRVRLRLPPGLAARLAEAEASGIRPWIVLVVAAVRAATASAEAEKKTAPSASLSPHRPAGT